MSRLHQIQLQFDPHQDRAVLRIRTTDQSEFLFWLTRRYIKLLWSVLLKMLEENEQVGAQPDPSTKQAVMAFQHESALSQADFKTEYKQEVRARPLGDAPVLLAKVQLRRNPQGQSVLVLSPQESKGIQLNLDQKMIHSLCKLITEVCELAQWNLDLKIQDESGLTAAAPAGGRLN